MAKGGVWRGLATLMASVTVFASAAQVTTYNWAARVNSMLGTNNYETVKLGEEPASMGDHFRSDFASLGEMLEAQRETSVEIAAEGMVLLKNEKEALPLAAADKVTLWGLHNYMPILGGMMGSTAMANFEAGQPQYNLAAAMQEQGFTVNQDFVDFYASEACDPFRMMTSFFGMPVPGHAFQTLFTTAWENFKEYNIGEAPLSVYPEEVLASADDSIAVVLLTRDSSEAADYYPTMTSALDSDTITRPLALSQNEKDLIEAAKAHSTKVIVLLNTSSAMEIEDLKNDEGIGAIVWCGQPGNYGFLGLAKILAGEVSPSGKLTDTYAVSGTGAPGMVNFGVYLYAKNSSNDSSISEYDYGDAYLVESEGIYEGYRYYETRYADAVLQQGQADAPEGSIDGEAWSYEKEVSYPFGYGLSYTTFTQTLDDVKIEVDGEGTATVTVTNTGSTAGKDVAELYVQAPYTEGGLEKSAVLLVGFAKTDVLEPGASQTLTITFDPANLASYDENAVKADGTMGAWSIEAGDYTFAIGNGAHAAINNILALQGKTDLVSLDENEAPKAENAKVWNNPETDIETYSVNVENALQNMDLNKLIPGSVEYFTRADWTKGWTPVMDITPTDDMRIDLANNRNELTAREGSVTWGADNGLSIIDFMKTDEEGTYIGVVDLTEPAWEQLVDQVTLEEAINYIENAGNGMNRIATIGLPANAIQDGPTGFANDQVAAYYIKWNPSEKDEAAYVSESDEGANWTMNVFPTEPIVASTFNTALVQKEGRMYGEESLYSNIPGTLAPGVNLHRIPYLGRSHEYYSEDPCLTGQMALYFCLGGTEKGLMTEPKHLAFNHQEANRSGASTFMTEQAARENDLRCFAPALSSNAAMGVMTSYNRVGCVYSSAHAGLLEQILRREWGYQGWIVTDMAAAPNYMNWLDSVMNGTNGMLTTESTTMSSKKGSMNSRRQEIEADGYFQQKMHDSIKYYLYSAARSNALNGITQNTEIRYVRTWWQKAILGVKYGSGALAVLCLLLWCLAGRKQKGGN